MTWEDSVDGCHTVDRLILTGVGGGQGRLLVHLLRPGE